jgi:hypothetical protein
MEATRAHAISLLNEAKLCGEPAAKVGALRARMMHGARRLDACGSGLAAHAHAATRQCRGAERRLLGTGAHGGGVGAMRCMHGLRGCMATPIQRRCMPTPAYEVQGAPERTGGGGERAGVHRVSARAAPCAIGTAGHAYLSYHAMPCKSHVVPCLHGMHAMRLRHCWGARQGCSICCTIHTPYAIRSSQGDVPTV